MKIRILGCAVSPLYRDVVDLSSNGITCASASPLSEGRTIFFSWSGWRQKGPLPNEAKIHHQDLDALVSEWARRSKKSA